MRYDRSDPDSANGFQAATAALILSSYQCLTTQALISNAAGIDAGRALYDAPCVVLAHDSAPDPVFFYANRAAQQLFEMSWAEMVALPSRHSAEPLAREERQRLLAQVARRGYIDDYSGVRVSKTGKRFLIESATVWNLMDDAGQIVGQAASFGAWVPLD
ncbi:MAG: MEKHLA domain-containing protein [Betaproteobacteria bacterium]|nr:MEKHLA domain-containing protein [Betaproteobacteria bacterium]